jgi:hypothetical protein
LKTRGEAIVSLLLGVVQEQLTPTPKQITQLTTLNEHKLSEIS